MSKHSFSSLQKNTINIDEDKSGKILVLGVGNYLMGDEGVGVQIIHKMSEQELPDYIDILDGGTGGFSLMGYFDEYPFVIFLDATMDGKPAGTITQITPKFAADFPSALSVHDVGLKDMVEALYLQNKVPNMQLFTISISEIQPMTLELSKEVEDSIPLAIEDILKTAKEIHAKQII